MIWSFGCLFFLINGFLFCKPFSPEAIQSLIAAALFEIVAQVSSIDDRLKEKEDPDAPRT